MKRISKAVFTCLLASVLIGSDSASAATTWNYKAQGRDWPTNWAKCGAAGQSPIDLATNAAKVAADKDEYVKHYQNIPRKKTLITGGPRTKT